jgi:hypothetical protein
MDQTLIEKDVPLEKIYLDPNNYRFRDSASFVHADSNRFAEESVQQIAYRRLREEGLTELKNSIMTNGFLRFERIVVRPYGDSTLDAFVVVEGNRRIAALKWIKEDFAAGVAVPPSIMSAMEGLPVIVLNDEDEATYLSLMGVRHVGGIKQWGGYQRAQLVTELLDDFRFDRTETAARLGMSVHEVNRRYRAFKALAQMEGDEEYGDRATPSMYPLFHEAVALPIVREWLKWDEQESRFTRFDQLQQFYELLAPSTEDGRDSADSKLATYSDVRQLREILENQDARRVLFDPSRRFSDAALLAKAEEFSKSWASQVAEATSALSAVSAIELERLTPDDTESIVRLIEIAQKLIEGHRKLTAE